MEDKNQQTSDEVVRIRWETQIDETAHAELEENPRSRLDRKKGLNLAGIRRNEGRFVQFGAERAADPMKSGDRRRDFIEFDGEIRANWER